MWDLNTKSVLLIEHKNGRDILYPFETFKAHLGPTTGVAFCPKMDKAIATCGQDRYVLYALDQTRKMGV